MLNEREFYKRLAILPDVPSDLGETVAKSIRQRKKRVLAAFAAAATLIAAAGTFGVLQVQKSMYASMQQDVTAELSAVHEYLNAADAEEYLNMYASIEY